MNNKYCVYSHHRKDNDQLFYIGQGTVSRANYVARKLKVWHSVVKDAGGFSVKIIKDNLTKSEALNLEEKLIRMHGSDVINLQHSSSRVKHLDFSIFNDLYYIDNTSVSGLRYKRDVYAHDYGDVKYSVINRVGDVAGNKCPSGWQVSFRGKCYRVHRIIYLLSNGAISVDKVIDHIDGDNLNNAPDNLREVSHKVNRRNTKVDKRSATKVTGVSRGANGTYRASINSDSCRLSRSFSISKHGEQEAFHLACEWRKEQIRLLNEQGAGYTERHGT